MTFEQIIQDVNRMRDNIVRQQTDLQVTVMTGFDGTAMYLNSLMKQSDDQTKEILRLQELCKKKGIDYTIPPQPQVIPSPANTPSQVVAPAPSTQELSNPPAEVAPAPETSKA